MGTYSDLCLKMKNLALALQQGGVDALAEDDVIWVYPRSEEQAQTTRDIAADNDCRLEKFTPSHRPDEYLIKGQVS